MTWNRRMSGGRWTGEMFERSASIRHHERSRRMIGVCVQVRRLPGPFCLSPGFPGSLQRRLRVTSYLVEVFKDLLSNLTVSRILLAFPNNCK